MRRCHTRRAQRHASRDGGHASELLQQLRSGLQSLLYHRCIDCRRFDDDDDLFDILYTSGSRRCGVDGNVHGLFIEHSIELAFYDDNDSLFSRLVLHPPPSFSSSSCAYYWYYYYYYYYYHHLYHQRTEIRCCYCLACPKKEKRKVISQRERPSRSRWFLFFLWANLLHTLDIKMQTQTASHSREEYITSSFKFSFSFGFLIVFGMYTSALGGGGYRNRDKVYIRYLYTRNRMMMMMTTTMTMLLTTLLCTYVLANKMSENRNNLEDTQVPYPTTLTCPTAS